MKAIILCGGLGSRLFPLTYVTNKHLLPIYDKPMVYYPIQTAVDAGIKDIMIVTGGQFAGDFIKTLKNGEDFGLDRLNYAFQEGEGGIADALAKAESFVGDDSCMVILGDNLIFEDFSSAVSSFKSGARVFTKQVHDPERFGVLYEDESGFSIIEKPKTPTSNNAVIGVYIYDNTVFERIRTLTASERGELEVTDLNNSYAFDNKLIPCEVGGTWIDCGTFDSLLKASNLVKENA